MKILTLLFIMLSTLAACGIGNDLPNLEGKTKEEIQGVFDDKGWHVDFIERSFIQKERSYQFIEYGHTDIENEFVVVIISSKLHDVESLPQLDGLTYTEVVAMMDESDWDYTISIRAFEMRDKPREFIKFSHIDETDGTVVVVLSAMIYDEENMFRPVDIDYDGPYLDDKYFNLTEYPYFLDQYDPVIGGGAAFEVGYRDGRWHESGPWFNNRAGGCIDGDTTVFEYPTEVLNEITSGTPSTRYLNLDTPETWSGVEEEWGQPATQYVCSLLAEAQSIVLQTDPGDNLLGNHGRLLAWVWIQMPGEDEYMLLNYKVVRQGLGEVAYLFGAGETDILMYDGLRYNDWMLKAEEKAIDEGLGMHSDTLYDPYWDYDNDRPNADLWP